MRPTPVRFISTIRVGEYVHVVINVRIALEQQRNEARRGQFCGRKIPCTGCTKASTVCIPSPGTPSLAVVSRPNDAVGSALCSLLAASELGVDAPFGENLCRAKHDETTN